MEKAKDIETLRMLKDSFAPGGNTHPDYLDRIVGCIKYCDERLREDEDPWDVTPLYRFLLHPDKVRKAGT